MSHHSSERNLVEVRLGRGLISGRGARGSGVGRRQRARRRQRGGMSLVEIMVVIAIITTLMGIVGYGVMQIWQGSRVDTTILQMGEVNKRIELYSLKHGTPSMSEGLAAVYGEQEPPVDAWQNEFVYVSPGPGGMDYDVVSYGKDGTEGGEGLNADIRWSEVR